MPTETADKSNSQVCTCLHVVETSRSLSGKSECSLKSWLNPQPPSKAGRSERPTLPAARPTNLHEMKVATDALGEEMNLRMNLGDLKVPGFGLRAVPGSLDENTTNTIVNHSRLYEIYLS